MITSAHNRRVAAAIRLRKRGLREKERLFLVEGVQGVLEALRSAHRVREVFHQSPSAERLDEVVEASERAGAAALAVSADVMGRLTSTVTPQGVVAVVEFLDVPMTTVARTRGVVPLLVEVRDPGNAGTILRSADAAGAAGVVFSDSSVDAYNPKAVRATAGSLFHVPIVRDVPLREAVDELRTEGFAILGTAADGERSLHEVDLTGPTGLLFGNEAQGLGPEARALADATLRIPIASRAESLNLAAAATLVLFEAARQRAGGPSLARIVAGAAHDIRSPLTALRGFGQTLLSRWDRLDDADRRTMIEGIVHDGLRMDVIVGYLVDAARLLSGTLQLDLVPVDLLAEAERVKAEATAWGELEIEVSGPSLTVTADPARVRRILDALVESVQWWGEEGPVHVEVTAGRPPRVSVWRAARDLPGDLADGLFRPREPGSGRGSKVGPFVARGLAEALGWSLRAEADAGIRFVLTLWPHRPDEAARDQPPPRHGASGRA